MRTFKTRSFARFARRESIGFATLCDAVRRAGRGLVDANLGSGIIKQRIAQPGEGRSGGYRAIVVFRRGDRAVFVHGFAKSDQENLRRKELMALRILADEMLGLNSPALKAMLAIGTISEVDCND